MDLYKNILRPILFKIDPELIHEFSIRILKSSEFLNYKQTFCYQPKFKKTILGMDFPNPIGLAAGFDKNAHLIDVIESLGFGFIEVGTITPRPQSGNPRPRLFRFPKDESVLNYMGFNNDGVIRINRRLEKRKSTNIIVGANIGKNRDTDLNLAYKDYVCCVKELYSNVDYFTLNVSSPNTYGLRNLLDIEPLKYLLDSVQNQNKSNPITRPILLKISPDMTDEQIIGIADMCVDFEISGLISTNTTINHNYQKGGLSGKPLSEKSLSILKTLNTYLNKKLILISSGGIMDQSDAKLRFENGSDLIQLYTGLIYEGPFLPYKILKSYDTQ